MSESQYRFAEFQLDCASFELRRRGRTQKSERISLERIPMELLILLLERQGSVVTRQEIVDRLWGKDVFVDTEHGINTAIRKIRQVLRDDPENPRYLQTVTGKGYRFIAAIAGQPPRTEASSTNVIATATSKAAVLPFPAPPEVRNSGIEPHPVANPPIANPSVASPHVTHRVLWTSAIVLAAIGISVGARMLIHFRAATASIHSLAILPLDNLSGDPNQEYFADGMTDELTTMLAKDSTLRIVSRTSVMQYKKARRPLPEIARALGVDGIVEGSVSRSGNQVHLTLQLIRAETDSHLWAESYDRDSNDLALSEQAAQAIARRLRSAVLSTKAARYVNPAAHDAYLRGRYLWFTDRMMESAAWFRKATEIQPDYAEAWAGLANYYGEGIAGDALDPRTSRAPEEEAAQRAMQLDPDSSEAHLAMAAVYLIDRWDWANADREALRAIGLNPQNAELYYFRSNVLDVMNRFPEAIESAKKSMELDPFARPNGLAVTYAVARQYDAALADLRLRLEAAPNDPDLLLSAWDTWRRKGNYKEAMEAWARWHIAIGDPQSAASLRRAWDQGGAHGFVHWELGRRLLQSKTHYVSPVELACYYAQLGDKDRTVALLEEGYSQRSTDVLWIQEDPAYDFLHKEPRYRALIQKIGLVPTY
jgi:TolB-like protein/DNA-binding winged helix-turn-helix (wHTH) protein